MLKYHQMLKRTTFVSPARDKEMNNQIIKNFGEIFEGNTNVLSVVTSVLLGDDPNFTGTEYEIGNRNLKLAYGKSFQDF